MTEKIRNTADWEHDAPISEDLLQRLYHALDKRYPGKMRRALLVCPVAVEKVIDNEADARETLRRLEAADTLENWNAAQAKETP